MREAEGGIMNSLPKEVPREMEQQISEAIDKFLKKSSFSWERHDRYHDEPIWILRVEENQIVKKMQLALFDEPDGLFFYIIPDHSGFSDENRLKLRRKGRDYRIPFTEFKKGTLVENLQTIEKLLIIQ